MIKKILAFVLPLFVACGSDGGYSLNNPPGKFEVEAITSTSDVVTISWTASIDPDNDPVTYQITQGDFNASGITRLNHTFSGLVAGASYEGTISAIDNKGGVTTISYSYTQGSNNTNDDTTEEPDNSSDNQNNTDDNSTDNKTFNIPAALKAYYKDVDFTKTSSALYDELATLTIAKHNNILDYTERHPYLKKADADLTDKSKVVLIYTGEKRNISQINGSVNTEHVFPQSKITNTAKGDLHHLRYCDSNVNSNRGNYPFTSGSGSARKIGSNAWYPGDDWRGDVARMIMYMNIRYREPWGEISTNGVDLFLKWNAEDPISELEKQRNNEIEKAQGNRNPFIDNPYLATLIWGKDAAQNLWK